MIQTKKHHALWYYNTGLVSELNFFSGVMGQREKTGCGVGVFLITWLNEQKQADYC